MTSRKGMEGVARKTFKVFSNSLVKQNDIRYWSRGSERTCR